MFVKSTVAFLFCLAVPKIVVATDGPDRDCGTAGTCYLVDLDGSGPRHVFDATGVAMTPGVAADYDPSTNRGGWSIFCETQGKIEYVKYFLGDDHVNTHYSVPFWINGDNSGKYVNKLDSLFETCSEKTIKVNFYSWSGGDDYPCDTLELKLKSAGVCPTKSPTASPTAGPTMSPTANPTASPTMSPTASPTASPTMSPTASPTVSPTMSPTASPTAGPTMSPTASPTASPTMSPTASPTTSPTKSPTMSPTATPTTSPTKSPTASPTKSPTASPTCANFQCPANSKPKAGLTCISSFDDCVCDAEYDPKDGQCVANCVEPPPHFIRCHLCRRCKNIRMFTSNALFPRPFPGTPEIQVVKHYTTQVTVSQKFTNIDYRTVDAYLPWPEYPTFATQVAQGSLYVRATNVCGSSAWRKCSIGSPVAIDLDRSGAVEHITGDFDFDLSGNGYTEELTEWFAPTEGILVDSTYPGFESGNLNGWHLYGDLGDLYEDGFDKLALHDFNNDGVVSGEELNGIAIWTDSNSNAVLDIGELSTLDDYDIVSLSLDHDEEFISSATLKDGSKLTTRDLWFAR